MTGFAQYLNPVVSSLVHVMAAAPDNNAPPDLSKSGATGNFTGQLDVLTSYEFWLTVSILAFGALVMITGCRFIASRPENTPDQIIKLISVNLIVIGTLVIITGGFSEQQIAPAFGLFGTIAGYLLGRSDRPSTDGKKTNGESDGEGGR